MRGRGGTGGGRIRALPGFSCSCQFKASYGQSSDSLPGTAEAVEGGGLAFGFRRQEGIKLGEDVGAIDDVLVAVEGDYVIDFGILI